MRVLRFLGCLCAIASLALGADLAIRNVTVIDVSTGAELPRQTVLIHGKRITAVGAQLKTPPTSRVIDGAGKYLIPGLWDMDVHLWRPGPRFSLYLANGITGVRDMGGDLNWIEEWRSQIRAGALLGPHIETCGPGVDGRPSPSGQPAVLVAYAPADARETFDRLYDMNVDFVRVLPGLQRDAYFALLERARKYYLPVAGHVPDSVTVEEAVDARQKSFEHMTGILLACSSHEEKLRGRHILAIEKRDAAAGREILAEELATFDAAKAARLFEDMARFESREAPALVLLRRSTFADAVQLAASPYLRFIPASIRGEWKDPREERKSLSPEAAALLNAEYAKLSELAVRMKKAGVAILAGTASGDPWAFPGFDLHRELQLLVEAGLTPLEALQSATLEPARFLDATDSLGAIEPGRLADLVLLEGDPLRDIRNTQKIGGVFVEGQYLSKAQLNGMLAAAPRSQ